MTDNIYIQFAQTSFSVMEGENNKKASITLTRTGNLNSFADVQLQLTDGTAQAWQDYLPNNLWVNFAAGETQKTVLIDIPDDAMLEGTETVNLQLVNSSNRPDIVIPQSTAQLNILDNEASYIQFSQTSFSVMEGENNKKASITLTRTGNLNSFADVQLQLTDGTAQAWQDYLPNNLWVNFAAGETQKTVLIDIPDDAMLEGTETVNLQLVNSSNRPDIVIPQSTAQLNILDNEASYIQFSQTSFSAMEGENNKKASITLTRTGNLNSFADVQLQLTDGTAQAGQDYLPNNLWVNFAAGETQKTVLIDIPDDAMLEGTETVNLQLVNFSNRPDIVIPQSTAQLNILDNEASYIQFSQTSFSVMEGENNKKASITLTRTGNLNSFADVQLQLTDGTAQAGQDYLPNNLWVNFAAGESQKTVLIDIPDDAMLEGTETVNLKLVNFSNRPDIVIPQSTAQLNILDNEASYIQFSQTSFSAMEGENNKKASITLTRTGNLNSFADVQLQLTDGTAQAGQDYLPNNLWVNFAAGESQKTVLIDIPDDAMLEGTETVNLKLVNFSNRPDIVIPQSTAQLNILDNEASYIQFSQTSFSAMEGENNKKASITLTRTGNLNSFADVQLQLTDGTAQAGQDYLPNNLWVNFAAGESQKTVLIDIPDDAMLEGTETVNLKLVNFSNRPDIVIPQSTAQLNILDNEASYIQFSQTSFSAMEGENNKKASITLTRTGNLNSFADVQLQLTDGTAQAWQDYLPNNLWVNFAAGESQKTVLIDTLDDAMLEGTETVNLKLVNFSNRPDIVIPQSTAQLNILDNEASYIQFSQTSFSVMEGTGTRKANITFNRTGNINSFANLDLRLSGGTAQLGQDYLSSMYQVNFNPGQVQQTVDIDILDDTLLEGTETVNLALVNSFNRPDIIVGSQGTAQLNILDNEVAYLQLSQATYSIMEGIGTKKAAITLNRTGNLNNLAEVDLRLSNGSALLGQDYNPSLLRVSFAAGQTQQIALVDILDDTLLEGTETINLTLANPSNRPDVAIGSQNTAQLSILDNEAAYVQLSQASYNVLEGEGNKKASITLTRTGQLNSNFSVDLRLSDGTAQLGQDYAPPVITVNFASGQTQGTAVIDIADDTLLESTETINLTLANLSNRPDVIIGSQGTAQLNIFDNERVDTLTGTPGADTFVIGNQFEPLYDNYGVQDFALIVGFDTLKDKIQLKGNSANYRIGDSPLGVTSDKAIFMPFPGREDELLAIVKGVPNLNLNSSAFSFIP